NYGVMSTTLTINGHEYFQLGIAVNPGNSGGPAIDLAGQVIGVVVARDPRKQSLAFCIPAERLNDALAKYGLLSKQEVAGAGSQHRLRVVYNSIRSLGE